MQQDWLKAGGNFSPFVGRVMERWMMGAVSGGGEEEAGESELCQSKQEPFSDQETDYLCTLGSGFSC